MNEEASELHIPGYRPRKKLEQRRFGSVWRAHQTSLDRTVRLKIANPDDTTGTRLWRREAKLLGRVRHEGLISSIDEGQAQGRSYFVFEDPEGQSLTEAIRTEGRLPWTQAVTLTVRICDVVAGVHDQGVRFREIRPDQVVVTPDERVILTSLELGVESGGQVRPCRLFA